MWTASSGSTQQGRAGRPKLWSDLGKPAAQQPLDIVDLTSQSSADDAVTDADDSPANPTSLPSPPFHTRIGLDFQARLPPLAQPPPPPASSSSPFDGEPVWQPSLAPSAATVDAYLASVQDLFAERPDDFDEETALLFLHRCHYNTQLALSLVQPHALSREAEPPAAVEGGASPPSDVSPASSEESSAESEDDTDDVCSVCMDGGTLIICERRGCRRVYHVDCAGLKEVPRGRWECPVHFCSVCGDDWTEGSRRKKARLEASSGVGANGGMGGGAAGGDTLKPITSHPSLISGSSQAHLLSPASSHSPSPSSFANTSPPEHIACTSCPTAYCLPHMPPSLATAYSVPVEQLGALTLEELQRRVAQSANKVFLCLSCIGVQERRRRLDMLRRLNSVMDEREEKAKSSSSKPAAAGLGRGKGESERAREDSDPLFALYRAFKQQELRDDEAAASDESGTSEGLGFDRMLHHPTEWRRLEGTLKTVEMADGKQADSSAMLKGGSATADAMRD